MLTWAASTPNAPKPRWDGMRRSIAEGDEIEPSVIRSSRRGMISSRGA
jgi:hypothetical protein